tara:strand:- start:16023 stop:19151 length:3129 start_codon:yes stop_codon:yes gene_type:complete
MAKEDENIVAGTEDKSETPREVNEAITVESTEALILDSASVSDNYYREGEYVKAAGAFIAESTGLAPVAETLGYDPLDRERFGLLTRSEQAAVSVDIAAGVILEDQSLDEANDLAVKQATLRQQAKASEDENRQDEQDDPEALAARTRLAEQCYLMWNFTILAALHVNSMVPASIAGDNNPIPRFTYNKTHLIDGNPSEVIPKLKMRPGTESLLDIKTSQLAELVPKLNLYKIIYNDEGEVKGEIPFKFYNHTITKAKADRDWASDSDTSVLDPKVRPGGAQGRMGVGIKSFDWAYISTNPDTIENDITAKLVLYFQSMDELIRNRQTILGETAETYSYLDLIVAPNFRSDRGLKEASGNIEQDQPDGETCGPGSSQYDSSFYEIKAVVGWSDYRGADPALIDSLRFNQVPLFLTLQNHEFSINEDGTFELSIEYRGRMDGILVSPKSNILLSGGGMGSADTQTFQDLAALQNILDEFKKNGSCEDSFYKQETIKKTKDKMILLKDQLRIRSRTLLLDTLLNPETIYKGFESEKVTTGYRTSTTTPGGVNAGKKLIHSLPITQEELSLFSDARRPASDEGLVNVSDINRYEGDPVGEVDNYITDSQEKTAAANSWLEYAPRVLEKIGFGPSQVPAQASEVASSLQDYTSLSSYDPGDPSTLLINFFYLGDLVDIIASYVFNNTAENSKYSDNQTLKDKYAFKKGEVENLRVLLGPFEYKDPQTEATVRANLADVPISVRLFVDFFHRKVILKQKDTYNFATFIKDMVNDLVYAALGADCFGETQKQRAIVRTAFIDGPATEDGKDPIVNKSVTAGLEEGEEAEQSTTARLNLNAVSYRNPIFAKTPYEKSIKNYYQYIVIYAQGPSGLYYPGMAPNSNIEGQKPSEVDRERGIHHLNIGSSTGVLKRVNFSKTDAPYIREARVEGAGTFDPIQQLSDVYELSIDMVGNTLFYPGSYLYLNPFGLGSHGALGMPHRKSSLSNIMGLGGYHIITRVESYIESGMFKTVVKARYESSGDGCRITAANEDNVTDCPEDPPTTLTAD